MSSLAADPHEVSNPLLWSTDALKHAVENGNKRGDLVKRMIPSQSVNIAVGESGLGKTPLFYDMAIRVAAGLPFLDCDTVQGTALIVDFENGDTQRVQLCETLAQTAGLREVPPNLLHDPTPGEKFSEKIRCFKPALCVIDSLKTFCPEALQGDGVAALTMLNELHALARETDTAFLLIHHLRKMGHDGKLPDFANTPVLEWLQEAAGTRSFVNQTDVRMGIAEDRQAKEDTLAIRYYTKLRGEFGPLYVERVYHDDEPVGYRRMSGSGLLRNAEYELLFRRLPMEFRYREAIELTGKQGGSLSHFLERCQAVGILRKNSFGHYVKLS